jgi:hypothetical protein
MNMKRIASAAILGLLLALAGSLAFAQSAPLGDYARQVRKQKQTKAPAAKSYDNDTLPRDEKLSVVGEAPAQTADASAGNSNGEPAPASGDSAAAANAPAGDKADASAQNSAEEKKPADDEQAQKQKMYKEWQTKIQGQQAQIDSLAKEIDLADREYRLRAAAFYADAGNRLRNATAWDKQDAEYKQQMVDRQKKLEDAKKQLEDMQEQARKAGVPSSMRE